ncbi:MAG TPA: DUF3467 domain-containing protein [Candidatus Nanoarchaeia archaeon]|nr:DUF3467 domain-containing protein [Candidatus Nanoarchaeia archaeon]
MTDERINMSIVDGDAFFAHELSINFNPLQFIFDFKCITPRIDPRSKLKASINLKHNVVLADPYHAKKIHQLLGEIIRKYEKEYGKIEKPKQIKHFEKKPKTTEEEKTEVPTYFG